MLPFCKGALPGRERIGTDELLACLGETASPASVLPIRLLIQAKRQQSVGAPVGGRSNATTDAGRHAGSGRWR